MSDTLEEVDSKVCTKCNVEKPLEEFTLKKKGYKGRASQCRACYHEKYLTIKDSENARAKRYHMLNKDKVHHVQKEYRNKTRNSPIHIKRRLLTGAKKRAKLLNREFKLTLKDLPDTLPEYCPVFPHLKLVSVPGKATDNSYSLDRINSNQGYIPGNIQIISYRANILKSDRTLEEQEMLLKYLREQRRIRTERYLRELEGEEQGGAKQ